MNCLQLRGRGDIAATDGHHILIRPALHSLGPTICSSRPNLLLGCKELDTGEPVQVGFAGDWVTLGIGPWLISFKVNREARFTEALARWESAGATAAQLDILRSATIEIRDLSDPRTLALAGGNTIVLDTNAAGRGWFLDSTPSHDEEFSVPLTTSAARAATGPAVDRVDLLTTVMHEYGHLLGLDDHLAPPTCSPSPSPSAPAAISPPRS